MRIGLIGIGTMARHHARAATRLGATVVSACASSLDSRNWDAFLREFPCEKRRDAEQVVEDSDAVIVCPRWDVTQHMMPMLLDSEKPMLIEKPVALRSEQAKAFLRAARCPHNKMIGFNRRFYRPVLALKKELGTRTPKSVHVVVSEHLDHHRRNTGEDVIRHLVPFTSVHTIDLVQFLFENATVKAMYRTEEGEFVSYNGLLESGGMPIFLGINANDPSPVGFWVRFPDETWVLSPLETLRMYRGISVDASGPVRRYTPAICGEVLEEGPGKPGILEQMRAFLSGRYAEGARLEDCVRQLELIDEIRRA